MSGEEDGGPEAEEEEEDVEDDEELLLLFVRFWGLLEWSRPSVTSPTVW